MFSSTVLGLPKPHINANTDKVPVSVDDPMVQRLAKFAVEDYMRGHPTFPMTAEHVTVVDAYQLPIEDYPNLTKQGLEYFQQHGSYEQIPATNYYLDIETQMKDCRIYFAHVVYYPTLDQYLLVATDMKECKPEA